jgi:hypothetical protein
MRALKMILRIFLFISLLLTGSSAAIHGQDFPIPFDRIKAVAIAQGQEDNQGTFMWEKQVENVEYWMVYSQSDQSVGCGKRTNSGSYGWGIAYGLKGDFQFVEARMGQVVNFLLLEQENAIDIANQFLKELEGLLENPTEVQAQEKWVKI